MDSAIWSAFLKLCLLSLAPPSGSLGYLPVPAIEPFCCECWLRSHNRNARGLYGSGHCERDGRSGYE
jgi:hypothetical protein